MNHPKTEIEDYLDERDHRVTVEDHQQFREAIAPSPPLDPIDEALADIPGPAQTRKEGEVSKLLAILDELETGKDGQG